MWSGQRFHKSSLTYLLLIPILIFSLLILALCGFFPLQERTITGKVTSSEDGSGMPGVNVVLKGSRTGTVTDSHGLFSLRVPSSGGTLVFTFIGFATREVPIGNKNAINVQMYPDVTVLEEVITGGRPARRESRQHKREDAQSMMSPPAISYSVMEVPNTEEYEGLEENIFHGADKKPLSTFSIDVDAASYSNLRRFINEGQRPAKDAVRIEEMINYFDYDYKEPKNGHPFSVYTEISQAPWNDKHQLIHIGLQGRNIPVENLPASYLVFLIDVSGSMNYSNKLPLVKKSFQLLVDQLRPQDHVAMVVYAGAAGVVLEPTRGDEKRKILS